MGNDSQLTGNINSNGFLEILRGKEFKQVQCPIKVGKMNCGDQCALFSEPYHSTTCLTNDSEYCTVLHLCGQTTHEFIEFNDGRK